MIVGPCDQMVSNVFLVRLSLIQNGLSEEFDVQRIDGSSEALVNILPTCTPHLYVRGIGKLLITQHTNGSSLGSGGSIGKLMQAQCTVSAG